MRRSILSTLVLSVAACGPEPAAPAALADPPRSALGTSADVPRPSGRRAYYVVLEGAPAADAWLASRPAGRTGRGASTLLGPVVGPSAARVRLAEIAVQHAALEPQVTAAGGKVIGRFGRLANALLVLAPDGAVSALASLRGVRAVERVPIVKAHRSRATPRVGAPLAWSGPRGVTGAGVTLAVIDTGIDYTHADFGGPGTSIAFDSNDSAIVEPGTFPTARVVGGFDFAGNAYEADVPERDEPAPDADPLDCGGHGTHVAGIAAGGGVQSNGSSFAGPYDGVDLERGFRSTPGVAPDAQLYAYKVFGCGGATGLLFSALERSADPDEDGDFSDRIDVINGSLGSEYGVLSDVEGEMIRRLTDLGTLFVAAAGNDGSGGWPFFAVGSPAAYPEVLSVAATLNAPREFFAFDIDTPASIAGTVPYSEGDFSTPLFAAGPITETVVATEPLRACDPITNTDEVSGRIALVERGECAFVDKFRSAEAAGARAIIITDHQESDAPAGMNGSGFVALPGVLVRKRDGDRMRESLAEGVVVTLTTKVFERTQGPDYVAEFSSRGPTAGSLAKPEVSAPGSPILSANVGSGTGQQIQQGTSQASPSVAGAAALLVEARPILGPLGIKAVLVNTAEPVVGLGGDRFPVSLAGGGRIQVDRAVNADVTVAVDDAQGAVTVAFGAVVAADARTERRRALVTNHGQDEVTFDVRLEIPRPMEGVSIVASPSRIAVPPGATVPVTLDLSVQPSRLPAPSTDPFTPRQIQDEARHAPAEFDGWLVLDGKEEAEDLTLPFHAVVRPAARRRALGAGVCSSAPDRIIVPLAGDSAHRLPVASAFELAARGADEDEVLALGVASDLQAAGSIEAATAYFAVVAREGWVTPAQGRFSRVRIFVDDDDDERSDRILVATPRSSVMGFEFFSDVLRSVVVDANSGDPLEPTSLLNAHAPDVLDTAPFFNDVLVFPARLTALGASTGRPRVRVRVVAGEPASERGPADWIDFDPTLAVLDTTSAGRGGTPFTTEGSVVADRLRVDASAELLILHHTNERGLRFETLPVDDASALPVSGGDLVLKAEGPSGVSSGERFEVRAVVENAGAEPARQVRVAGALNGGTLVSATSNRGPCSIGAPLECTLGDLAPGEQGVITVVAVAGQTDSATLGLEAHAMLPCEANDADNRATVEIAVDAETVSPVSVRGGCDCGVAGARRSPSLPVGVLLLGLLARRRFLRGAGGAPCRPAP